MCLTAEFLISHTVEMNDRAKLALLQSTKTFRIDISNRRLRERRKGREALVNYTTNGMPADDFYDYWPFPDEMVISPGDEELKRRRSIEQLFIHASPLTSLNIPECLKKFFHSYPIIDIKFLKTLSDVASLEHVLSTREEAFFNCSMFGETSDTPFAVLRVIR